MLKFIRSGPQQTRGGEVDTPATPEARGILPRRVAYALIGASLAQGAAAGLLLGRMISSQELSLQGALRQVTSDIGTFVYIAGSTTVAFALFGGLVGRYADRLARLATTDSLTGLLNTRAFEQRMHQEMVRATRYRQPLSVLVVDLDGLKHINDEHGHEAGNQALRSVAAAIRGRLREADLGGRLGGDEFAVLAPNTDQDSALVFGERLRTLVAEQSSDARLGTTVSVGIASLGKSGQGPETELSMMRAADAALYRAKRAGGNRAVI